MSQVMPAEVFNSGPFQGTSPGLCVHLTHRLSLECKNPPIMLSLLFQEDFNGILIQGHPDCSSSLGLIWVDPAESPFQVDLAPFEFQDVPLAKSGRQSKSCQIGLMLRKMGEKDSGLLMSEPSDPFGSGFDFWNGRNMIDPSPFE